jgi:type IV pilus assembly protein PilQ
MRGSTTGTADLVAIPIANRTVDRGSPGSHGFIARSRPEIAVPLAQSPAGRLGGATGSMVKTYDGGYRGSGDGVFRGKHMSERLPIRPASRLATVVLAGCASILFGGRAGAGDAVNRLHELVVVQKDGHSAIRLGGTATPTFTVYKLETPPRVVIDVARALSALGPRSDERVTWSAGTWEVSQVQVHPADEPGVVRIAVALARPGSYDVRADGKDVVITVRADEVRPVAAAAPAANAAELARARADARAARAELGQAQKELSRLQAQAGAAAAAASAEAQRAQEQTRRAEERMRAAEALVRTAEAQRAEAEALAARARRESRDHADREDAAAAARLQAAAAAVDAAENARRAAESHRASAEAARAAAERRRAAAEQAASAAQKRSGELLRAAAEAEKRAEAARALLGREEEALRAAAAARRRHGDYRRQIERAAQRVAASEGEALRAARVAEARRRELVAAETRLTALRRNEAAVSGGVADLERRLARLRRHSEEAEAALRRREDDLTRHRADQAALARQRDAAAGELRELVQRAEAARKERHAEQQRLAALRAERVRRDKELGAQREALARLTAELDAKANQLAEKERELLRVLAERKAQQQALSSERERAARELSTQREALRALTAELGAAQSSLAELTAQHQAQKRALATERQRMTALAAERQREEAALDDRRRELRALEIALVQQRDTVGGKRDELAALDQRLAADEKRLRQRREQLQRRGEASRAELERIQSQLRELEQQRAAGQKALTTAQAELAGLERRKQESAAAVTEARAQLAAVDQQRRAGERELERMRAELAALERSAAQLRAAARRPAAGAPPAAATSGKPAPADSGGASAASARRDPAPAPSSGTAPPAASARRDPAPAPSSGTAPPAASARRDPAPAPSSGTAPPAASAGGKPAPAAASDAVPAARVTRIDYVERAGGGRVLIELDGAVTPRLLGNRAGRAVLEIPGARLAQGLERTLDTTRFGGPVRAVSAFRDPRNPRVVRVVVQLDQPVEGALLRAARGYHWDFAAAAARTAQRAPRSTEYPAPIVGRYAAADDGGAAAPEVMQLGKRERKVYRGRKIDLDFKDADIHNLLRLLADVGGVNIVVPDEIKASVTVRLRNVPWDQAMEVILASKGLWYKREGTLVRVAPRKELDAEAKAEAERLRAKAEAEAPEPEIFTLNYAVAKEVQKQLVPLLSPKGRLEVDQRTNSLIVNDIAAHRRRIIELLTRLDTQTPQIQIEARVVEARTSYRYEVGVQWGGNMSATTAGGNATGLVFPSNVQVAGGADDGAVSSIGVRAVPSDFAVNLPAAAGGGSGGAIGLALGSVDGNYNLNLRLSALEDQGTLRIISAPNITVLNNELATISSGVSIPISVVSAEGVQTQFVNADLSLKVTPHVSQRDCSIAMELNVSKNEPDFVNTGARGDPSIVRKEADTTILVADGETKVIGGIYTRNSGLSRSKVPFFGDLPVIGWFFRNYRENDERTEVLVFITPRITNKAFLRCQ